MDKDAELGPSQEYGRIEYAYHLMSVNGKYDGIEKSDCLALADRFGIGEASSILKEVKDAIAQWPAFAKQAGVHPSEARRIQKQLI